MNLFQPDPFGPEPLKRVLEARRWRLNRYVSPHVLQGMDIEIIADRLMDQFAVSIMLQLHGEKVSQAEAEEAMEFPTTWFQHLKRDFAPDWVLVRWPVKTNRWKLKVKADQWRMYHNMQTALPEKDWGRPMVVIDYQTESDWL